MTYWELLAPTLVWISFLVLLVLLGAVARMAARRTSAIEWVGGI